MTEKKFRISITVSEDELTQWKIYNHRESLSAFIREAVNSYLETLEAEKTSKQSLNEIIRTNSNEIQRITEDLLEIQAALAKHDIIPDITPDTRIIHFIEQRMSKTDITQEDRANYEKIKQLLKKNKKLST